MQALPQKAMSMPTSRIDPDIEKALQGLPADFAGFDRVFEERLRPELQRMEQTRQVAAQKAKRGYKTGGAIAVLGIVGAFLLNQLGSQGAPVIIGIASILAGLVTSITMGGDLRKIGKQAKTLIVMPIAEEFGLLFEEHPGPQASIGDFRAANLVTKWDRSAYEDRVTGERAGVPFSFFEAHLEERRVTRNSKGQTQTRWVTVFRGQCLRFGFHKDFYGRTLVARDAGFFNRFGGGSGMKIAKLEDPTFEKIFSVYTTDQVESRYLLTPDIMQRFVDLEAAFHGGNMRCCFVDGEVLIAIENGDMFEPGSLFTPLDNPERVRELLDDFAAIFHLIDAMSDD